jgi:7,8-dihydropterin-6-yl-methyl-4-(beta-D-ribofuranosyl)aminobenzene 5'-phosphate synthase
MQNLTITVVYDNNPYKEELETSWGFSCVIKGAEKTILFDTGEYGSLLLDNMRKLAIEPNSIETIVLSHIHGDHTGGLDDFLKEKNDVEVYVLKSFPEKFKEKVRGYGSKVIEVERDCKICENVYSTGQLGRFVKEQSLIIKMDKGLIVITGCAHPGIIKILNRAKGILKEDIFVVVGGFHLEWAMKGRIKKTISAFKKLAVRYAGPCHCGGNKAKALFEKHFGENYINIGAGKVITPANFGVEH